MTAPIQPEFFATMNGLAKGLDTIFNGDAKGDDRKVGFALFCFEFDAYDNGRVNYISNAGREDMLAAVKEWVARAEGRVPSTGRGRA